MWKSHDFRIFRVVSLFNYQGSYRFEAIVLSILLCCRQEIILSHNFFSVNHFFYLFQHFFRFRISVIIVFPTLCFRRLYDFMSLSWLRFISGRNYRTTSGEQSQGWIVLIFHTVYYNSSIVLSLPSPVTILLLFTPLAKSIIWFRQMISDKEYLHSSVLWLRILESYVPLRNEV